VAFHVFIEKAVDPTPEGRARLAGSIAAKYRLPEVQIAQYLQAGRFRVKSNVDEATARKFASELQVMGAVVGVEDAQTGAKMSLNAGAATRVAPAPAPAPAPVRAPAGAGIASAAASAATLPAGNVRGGAAPGAPAPAVAPSGQRFESGLAAAFSAGAAEAPANLGALDHLDGVSLSSLDGGTDESFSGPVGLSAAEPPAAGSKPLPTNAFSAPDEAAELALDLADDVRGRPAGVGVAAAAPRAAGTPQPMAVTAAPHDEPLDLAPSSARPTVKAAPPAAAPLERTSLAGMQASAAPTPRALVRAPEPIEGGPLAPYFVDKPRQRLLAGAALALGLGFLPATYYASGAEDEKYGKIRNDLLSLQDSANTPSLWQALDAPDGARPLAAKSMERARGRIRANASIIWILVASGVALVWFKKLA